MHTDHESLSILSHDLTEDGIELNEEEIRRVITLLDDLAKLQVELETRDFYDSFVKRGE
jgi:hypothetical protein